jgi:putative nucleotidyltransferase with HDIG domain
MELEYNKLFNELIVAMSLVLDLDEARKLHHARRVAVLSTFLAEEITPDDLTYIFYAGLLHDIGNMGLSDHIVHYQSLRKQLSIPKIRVHPIVGAEIVSLIPGLEESVNSVLNHHEWWNGHGYPMGKSKEKIALGAQILRIADSFDLKVFHSPGIEYRGICQYLNKNARHEFSSQIVSLSIQLLKKDDIYNQIMDQDRLQILFERKNSDIPQIQVQPRQDVIGITLDIFAQVIDSKHKYTAGHSQRVSKYSLVLALAMELPHDDVTNARWAALLHDIGKVAIPSSILDKRMSLTTDEISLIRKHANITMEIVETITCLKDLVAISSHHHERYDGTGYPDGLKGEDIPLLSRIISIADAFDALTSDRAYRKGVSTERALQEIKKSSGTQFDPEIVNLAVKYLSTFI